ncbi:MAG: hypothetical protein AAGA18_15690 [Verrucomicrobiota bacterium]
MLKVVIVLFWIVQISLLPLSVSFEMGGESEVTSIGLYHSAIKIVTTGFPGESKFYFNVSKPDFSVLIPGSFSNEELKFNSFWIPTWPIAALFSIFYFISLKRKKSN